MRNILINVTTEPITLLTKNHISWDIAIKEDKIVLYEVAKFIYRFSSPQFATISQIERHEVLSCKHIDKDAAPLFLLKNALDNVSNFFIGRIA